MQNLHLAYTTYGALNESSDNVVWIFHALTANSCPHEWWPEMIGEGRIFDPSKHFIICVNMPGSCYGSISPLDVNPATGTAYYHQFPFFYYKGHGMRLSPPAGPFGNYEDQSGHRWKHRRPAVDGMGCTGS
ncbi:hypothetical protein KRR40_02425 [Niabella defluvii]|nr:hypothetical protein KRR40_02425 [Niabella sp. I65]